MSGESAPNKQACYRSGTQDMHQKSVLGVGPRNFNRPVREANITLAKDKGLGSLSLDSKASIIEFGSYNILVYILPYR